MDGGSEKAMADLFADRFDAGRRLGALVSQRGLAAGVVLGIPRGGIPVGREVASAIGAPFDVFVARKLGAPSHKEFGIGAIAEGGAYVLDRHSVSALEITELEIEQLLEREGARLAEYVALYREGRPLYGVEGRELVVVDDGLATGVTVEAAVAGLRTLAPKRVLVAVPVASAQAVESLSRVADEVLALSVPENFFAVGQFYRRFDQLPDDALVKLARQDP